jgi:hypothetical protein
MSRDLSLHKSFKQFTQWQHLQFVLGNSDAVIQPSFAIAFDSAKSHFYVRQYLEPPSDSYTEVGLGHCIHIIIVGLKVEASQLARHLASCSAMLPWSDERKKIIKVERGVYHSLTCLHAGKSACQKKRAR